ncbi:hypothetical protein P8452_74982 [Trifolium repens]|nr:hypothetical protein QL285_095755 [Trifolium repens]KAK2410724.1 hypothetical protein QL285_046073 [Trifolium repens]WJX93463.1 hypothetical protein P8452_74982 [Trifolium repens]
MIPLFLLIQSNQVSSKGKHTMERQVTKDASGSKKESKKGAEPWRCEENRLRYERNKEELILTESEEEELGSDLEEFLWTYEDNLADYPAEVQKLADEALSLLKEKLKSIESEASKSKP